MNSEFVDRTIPCLDCGQPFIFTAGEQEFYDRKGFREEPKRCKPCRDNRKARRTDKLTEGTAGYQSYGGGNGNGNGNGYGRGNVRVDEDDDNIGNRIAPAPRSSSPPLPRGPREIRDVAPSGRASREMFEAVCAECGTQTKVPFKPMGGRPVYCKDCYGARAGGGS